MLRLRLSLAASRARSASATTRCITRPPPQQSVYAARPLSSLPTHDETRAFRALAATFAAIETSRSSRDTCVSLLAQCLRGLLPSSSVSSRETTTVPSNDLAAALFLTASQLAPPHEGVELRFGAKTFVPVLQRLLVDGASVAWDELLPTLPDYSAAVPLLLDQGKFTIQTQSREHPMSVAEVHAALVAMASEQGNGSQLRKQDHAVALLQRCQTREELVFLVRFLAHQKLRISMGEKSILTALALACLPEGATETKPWTDAVVTAYSQLPDYGALAAVLCELLHDGDEDVVARTQRLLQVASPRVGVPVLTMAAYPIASVHEALTRLQKSGESHATCEFKYDGARVQLHWSPSTRRVFSRNMEDQTEKYGSLLDVLQPQLRDDITEIVMEGEVVAIDRVTGAFLPFQVLQTKTTTEFCLFAFDVLSVNGENLILKPLVERRETLKRVLRPLPGHVQYVEHMDIDLETRGPAEEAEGDSTVQDALNARVREYLAAAVGAGCEGLMVKALTTQAEYKAGARSFSWMKLKHDYLTDESSDAAPSSKAKSSSSSSTGNGVFLPDTLDLVPIAAFYGKGRRAGVFGSFLMASYDAVTGNYETIGKVGSGFNDAQLSELSELLKPDVVDQETTTIPTGYVAATTAAQRPDVWLAPTRVWEIKATQLTLSPSYTAGRMHLQPLGGKSRGLALRFPRFVRTRPEKSPDQATHSSQIAQLFQDQTADNTASTQDSHC